MDRKDENPLEAEMQQEKAASYFRVVKRMKKAVEAYREMAARCSSTASDDDQKQLDSLLRDAGEAVWFFIVQREAIKLKNYDGILDEYDVPREVREVMGPKI